MQQTIAEKVRGAALAMQRKDWEQGVVAQALWERGEREDAARLARASLIYAQEDGRLGSLASAGLIDCGMMGETIWRAALQTNDPALLAAEQKLRHYLLYQTPRAPDGTRFHVPGQVWVDSFHCLPPYLAAVGEFDEALAEIEGLRRRLWNPEARLYSHQWDENLQEFARHDFWGVGNGWAAAGLTRVLNALPPDRRLDRERLAGYLQELLEGCLAWQRPDGLFHDVLDRPETFRETNAAQMLAYAIYTGVAGGWLPDRYQSTADRMRTAAHAQVDTLGFVQDVCGAPSFDAPGIAPEGQAYFLLMEHAASLAR